MDRRNLLDGVRDRFHLLAIYLFGSRADDGLRVLDGEAADPGGSDLDIGVVFRAGDPDPLQLGEIHMALQEIFAPLQVDMVPLCRVDPIFQFRIIDGHRVAVSDTHRADLLELDIMRIASELLPVQRQLERDLFGVSTT